MSERDDLLREACERLRKTVAYKRRDGALGGYEPATEQDVEKLAFIEKALASICPKNSGDFGQKKPTST